MIMMMDSELSDGRIRVASESHHVMPVAGTDDHESWPHWHRGPAALSPSTGAAGWRHHHHLVNDDHDGRGTVTRAPGWVGRLPARAPAALSCPGARRRAGQS